MAFAGIISGVLDLLKRDMEVNYFGTLNVIHAFMPVLEKNGNAAIVNILSMLSLASMAGIGGYSASKAALFSATQAMRAELKAKNISVQSVFPGLIDTDMAKGVDMPRLAWISPLKTSSSALLMVRKMFFPTPCQHNSVNYGQKTLKS